MGQYFASLEYGNYIDLPHASMPLQCFINFKGQFTTEKYSSLVLPRSTIMTVTTPYYLIYALLSVEWYGRLKTKQNIKLIALKSSRSRLREVVAYKRFQIFHWETFGILENWSLRRGGRKRRFDCRKIEVLSSARLP